MASKLKLYLKPKAPFNGQVLLYEQDAAHRETNGVAFVVTRDRPQGPFEKTGAVQELIRTGRVTEVDAADVPESAKRTPKVQATPDQLAKADASNAFGPEPITADTTDEELAKYTVPQLKAHAGTLGLDAGTLRTKADAVSAIRTYYADNPVNPEGDSQE